MIAPVCVPWPVVRAAASRAPWRLSAALLLAPGALGCRDVERFRTGEDEAYCGSMVSAPVFQEGFLPDGEPPLLRGRLELAVETLESFPGDFTTDDAENGFCSELGLPLFDGAPLVAIEEVQRDALSALEFGEGREQNLVSWIDSSCAGPMLAVLSLMQSLDVELRVLRPPRSAGTVSEALAGEARPGFALFHLRRQARERCDY